jgi:hypothetical protein
VWVRLLFNAASVIILILSGLVAYAVAYALGNSGDRLVLMIFGPLVAALDLGYRIKRSGGSLLGPPSNSPLFEPDEGGRFFLLPIWTFGIFLLLVGIVTPT